MLGSLPEGEYCAYLRKSRVDLEAEASGGEDTYTKHERIILEMAKRYGVNLIKIYKERPISGERISARPEMLQLLEDIENEQWTGVLVVEVERLARGDTMDQGIVAQTFKYSNTLILTPMRVYDPNDPNDEEYFEFGLFMSRREYKTINRRQQEGRELSVKMGKFPWNIPPYGYNRVKLPGKGFTLEPHPDQAPIVQMIFELYTHPDPDKRMGTSRIARYLNTNKIPTARNSQWIGSTLNEMIRNTAYIGMVRKGYRPHVRKKDTKSRPRKDRSKWVEAVGLHPPLISEKVFQKAQEIMKENGHAPVPRGHISNPLASLIKCDMCGGAIVLRPYGGKNPPTLICTTQDCRNVSSYYHMVEQRLLDGLKTWVSSYKAELEAKSELLEAQMASAKIKEDVLKSLRRRLDELRLQESNLDDLLERKVYTIEKYMDRSRIIGNQISEVNESIARLEDELNSDKKRSEAFEDIIPKVEHVLEVYPQLDSPADKNALLKTVLEYATYRKEKGGRWSGVVDQFTLNFFPKVPRD